MSEEPLSFDYSRLSPKDQEILRTFLATNEFETRPPDEGGAAALPAPPAPQPVDPTLELEDEMIAVFAGEVEEDLAVLREGLERAERDEGVNSSGFVTLQQIAHKIRGSAAMIGCDAMSTIAHRIELVVHSIIAGKIELHTGLYGLGHAVGALEITLASVVTEKQEDLQPLLGLEQDFATLGISLEEPDEDVRFASTRAGTLETRARESWASLAPTLYDLDSAFIEDAGGTGGRLGAGDFDQIIRHTEQLIEQQTALEDARRQATVAFRELQAAQARLRRLEAFFSSLFLSATMSGSEGSGEGAAPASSLVARILREAEQRTGRAYQFEPSVLPLMLEDATRWDELEMDRFSETNLLAYALNEAIGDIATASAQLQHALAYLDTLMSEHIATTQQLHAGLTRRFPQATKLVRGLLARAWEQQVIIPFTQVLRIDYERQNDYDRFYTLNELLGFPTTASAERSSNAPALQIQPVLRVAIDTSAAAQVGVQVDEVVGQVELLSRQPPAPLQRPGLSGMAIDSVGDVLLVLDLPELIWREQSRQGQKHVVREQRETYEVTHQATHARPKILIADDSVSIRRTLRQTLSQKDYTILEAADGREALEKIEQESPNLLLLDLEMPRMNGYEVLNILRARSLLPGLKIALLTSRTSTKHKQRAQELGAHQYLTKPCSEDDLLKTVAELLA